MIIERHKYSIYCCYCYWLLVVGCISIFNHLYLNLTLKNNAS